MNIKLLTKEALKQCMLTAIKNNTKYFLIQQKRITELGREIEGIDCSQILTNKELMFYLGGLVVLFDDNLIDFKHGMKIINFKAANTLAEFEGEI